MNKQPSSSSFSLGQTVITANALAQLHPEDVTEALARHALCDWRDLDMYETEHNERALREGLRVCSTCYDRDGNMFGIITEADRSVTTVLLPEDFERLCAEAERFGEPFGKETYVMLTGPSLTSFSLGQRTITAKALKRLHPADVEVSLVRHARCDWGKICAADAEENKRALREGLRLRSAYCDRNGTEFWIITEADRSVTTVLLPED